MFTCLRAVTSRALVAAVAAIVAGVAAVPLGGVAFATDPLGTRLQCVRAQELQPPAPPVREQPSVTPPASVCPAGRMPKLVGRVAAKGKPVAPSPPGGGGGVTNGYWYASAQQTLSAGAPVMVGLHGSLSQLQPYLGVNDYHTLAEIAVESADLKQIVEVGWTVDRGVNGDTFPHLFVFHWINGAPTCYNACGFVPVLSPWSPGSLVPVTPVPQAYAIVHISGAASGWWIRAMGSWIGYFPDALWPAAANFTSYSVANWFGEVSARPLATPCSFMGDGIHGGLPGAALASNMGFYDAVFNDLPAVPATFASPGGFYAASPPFAGAFTFGGPGGGCA
jgi:hypothetical protein